jgi:hypothetical protein
MSADRVLDSGAEAVRVLACAAGGVSAAVCGASVRPADFLELFGFWLGAGVSRVRRASGIVQFVAASAADDAFVCERLARLGVSVAQESSSSTSTGRTHYVVRDASLCARFGERRALLSGARDALRHVVVGLEQAAGVRSSTVARRRAIATASVEFRDEVELLLLRAGYSVSTALVVASPSPVWHVSYGDGVEPTLRLRKSDDAVVAKRFAKRGVSWCCDMASSDDVNDGFVVVRRAERVAAVDFARLAAGGVDALAARVATTRAQLECEYECATMSTVPMSAADWVVVRASRATIQGNSRVGPVKWMAPEQLTELKYSRFSDVWSFACVCYEVMARRIPYEEDEIAGAIFKIMSRQWLQMPPTTPPALLSLVTRCWQWDAKARPTMEQVIAALNAATDPTTGEPQTRQSVHSSPMRTSALAASSSFGGTGDLGDHLQFKCDQCANAYQHQVDLDFHRAKRHGGSAGLGGTMNTTESIY